MPQPNVGHIDFLNVTPLGYAYRHHQAPDINICCGVPSQLNRAIREGTLDVSNVSSILYAKKADDLVILPDVCISADGAVKSILLVSRVPIEQIGTSPIALTQKEGNVLDPWEISYVTPDGKYPIFASGNSNQPQIPVFTTGTLTITGSVLSDISILLKNGRVVGKNGKECTFTLNYSGKLTSFKN